MISFSDRDCAFMAKNHLTASDIWCWKYILNHGKNKGVVRINLKKFNRRYKKLAKEEFSDRHLLRLLQKLERLGLLEVINRGFDRFTYDVIVYPISELQGHTCQQKADEPNEKKTETQEQRERRLDEALRQQQHKEVEELCQAHGIFYDKKTIAFICANYDIEEVRRSLKLYKRRSLWTKFENPPGWLRDCLRRGYWKSYKEDCPLNISAAVEHVKKQITEIVDYAGAISSELGMANKILNLVKELKSPPDISIPDLST